LKVVEVTSGNVKKEDRRREAGKQRSKETLCWRAVHAMTQSGAVRLPRQLCRADSRLRRRYSQTLTPHMEIEEAMWRVDEVVLGASVTV
jgi:hypothetical protein